MHTDSEHADSVDADNGARHVRRASSPPSPFVTWALETHSRALPDTIVRPRVADIACGSGRHTRLALELGYSVTAIDRDVSRLAVPDLAQLSNAPDLEVIETDLETGAPFPLAGRQFTAVVVTNYLHRPILPDIVACVADDGLLVYETFAVGNERHGRPSNPDFLLRPGELLDSIEGRLLPVRYEHATISALPGKCVQRIVAVGRDHEWLQLPPAL